MKRIFAVIMSLCILLSLCACTSNGGSNSAMMKELKTGTWSRDFTALGVRCSEAFSFKNSGKYESASLIGNSANTEYGTYKVTDTTIEITNESGETRSIHYTFEDGYLELTMRGSTGNEWTLVHNN